MSTSYILNNEELEAISVVQKALGVELPHVCGYHIAVKVYVREEEMKDILCEDNVIRKIYLPESVRATDKFQNCTGLVLSIGADAYKGDRFKHSGPWCKIGDWIAFPRNEGHQFNYLGIPIQVIPDDKAMLVVKGPSDVTRY